MRLIDMHCDTLWALMRKKEEDLKNNTCAIDVEKLKTADCLAQFFACFIYMDDFQGENRFTQAYEYALEMIAYAKQEISTYPGEMALATSIEEIEQNRKEQVISSLLTIEESGILDNDMGRLERLYAEGIRLLTLTWNYENCIGSPNSRDISIMQQGLKPFGKEVVERMNQLGMLVDVSHLSDGGFWDVIEHSKEPILASHSNARALCPHPRNLSDEMIRALAEKGGIAGLNLYPYFIHESGKITLDDIAEHVAHMYRIGGEDVLSIGTDFDGFDEGTSEIVHMGQMEQLYEAIKKRGFTDRQMEKIWYKNALRIMKQI